MCVLVFVKKFKTLKDTFNTYVHFLKCHFCFQALIHASQGPEAHDSMGTNYDEEASVFFFEQFITCILQNR